MPDDTDLMPCYHCDELFLDADARLVGRHYVCPRCLESGEFVECDRCGLRHYREDVGDDCRCGGAHVLIQPLPGPSLELAAMYSMETIAVLCGGRFAG